MLWQPLICLNGPWEWIWIYTKRILNQSPKTHIFLLSFHQRQPIVWEQFSPRESVMFYLILLFVLSVTRLLDVRIHHSSKELLYNLCRGLSLNQFIRRMHQLFSNNVSTFESFPYRLHLTGNYVKNVDERGRKTLRARTLLSRLVVSVFKATQFWEPITAFLLLHFIYVHLMKVFSFVCATNL